MAGQPAPQPNLPAVEQALQTLGQEITLLPNSPVFDLQQQLNQLINSQQTLLQTIQPLDQRIQHLDQRSSIRAVSSKQALNGPLMPIPAPGQPVPSNFPATPADLTLLPDADTVALLHYYDLPPVPGHVLARRRQLAWFLGIGI